MSAIQEAMRKAKREREGASGIQGALPKTVASPSVPRRRSFRGTWVIVGTLLALGVAGAILYGQGWIDAARLGKLRQLVPWSKGEEPKEAAPSQTATVGQAAPGRDTPRARSGVQAGAPESGARGRPSPAGVPPAAPTPSRATRPSGGEASPPVQSARPPLPSPAGSAAAPSPSAQSPTSTESRPRSGVTRPLSGPLDLQEARRLRAAGDFRAAEEILKVLVERDPASTEAVVALANLYIRDLREPQKALPLYQQALQRTPNRPSLHVNLGVYYLKAGDRAKAAEHLNRAVALDPNLAEAQYNRACLLALQGDRGAAEEALKRAVELDPRSAQWAKDDPDLAMLRSPAPSPVK